MAEPRILKLQSPAYGEPIFYKWPLANTKKQDEAAEITDTIKLVCEDFPELKYAVENFILKDYDAADFDSMNQLCQRYNKAIKNILQLWKGRAPPPHMFKPAKKELLRHVINLCFSHAIKEPEKLNNYEPFSPEVYGETSFDMVAQILDECQSSNEETFIDLGSGVGQVVLQAAASNQYKECFGIEKAETPAAYAQAMDKEFRKWMDWFGKIYTDFTLEKGDFLDEKWSETINTSGVVFVNNFAFGPVVNHHLKQKFQQMKEGAQIISSREFCPLHFKFNTRNLSELGAMMRVTELKPKSEEQTVSWTGNTVSYYLHVVDRTRLEKYFSILKKRKEGRDLDEDEMSLYSESNLSMDTTGTSKNEETLEDNLDDLYLGTTTRHQWQVLNKTIEQSRKDAKPIQKKKKEKSTLLHEKPRKAGNIKLKDKILQKYGYQKAKKNLLLANMVSIGHEEDADVDTTKKESRGRKKRQLAASSISTTPSSSDGEETDTADEDDTEVGDSNNNRIKATVRNKPKTSNERKQIVIGKGKKVQLKSIASRSIAAVVDKPKKIATTATTTKNRKQVAKKPLQKTLVDDEKPALKEGLSEDFLQTLDKDVDAFYDSMKVKAKEFIRRINTKEYAERLKIMIECEQTRKKLLKREVAETEQQVQQLINSGLSKFTKRLGELDLAVKTPMELLSSSSQLVEKKQELENKVVNMEVEVFNLEVKYRNMYNARKQRGDKDVLEPLEEAMSTEELDNKKNELTSQLCDSILAELNHRSHLLDKQSSLNDQISILEKIRSPTSSQPPSRDEVEKEPLDEEAKSKDRPKPRPVAFVPPRMLSDDKKSTVSPESPLMESPIRRPRGRPKKQATKQEETAAEISKDSKEEENDMVVERVDHQTTDPSNVPSSSHFSVYNAFEERAPIVFPRGVGSSLPFMEDRSNEEFLKASSKLLNSKGKWRPVDEIVPPPVTVSKSLDTHNPIPLDQKASLTLTSSSPHITSSLHMKETEHGKEAWKTHFSQLVSHPTTELSPTTSNMRPSTSVYDNLRLTYSQQCDILNRSLALNTSACHINEEKNQAKPVQPATPDFSPLPQASFICYDKKANSHAKSHQQTLPAMSSGQTKISTDNSAGITVPPAKLKRGRKRKKDTEQSDKIVIPGNHKHSGRKKSTTSSPSNKKVEQHYNSPLGSYYQLHEKMLSERATAKQMQSVITANPVSYTYAVTEHATSVVVPPSVPSPFQTISHRHSNLDILKQAAVAALPEKQREAAFQTLSRSEKFFPVDLPPPPAKMHFFLNVPHLTKNVVDRDLKEILPVTKPSPLNTKVGEVVAPNNSLYALHNRLIEQNLQPPLTSTVKHSYVPIISSARPSSNDALIGPRGEYFANLHTSAVRADRTQTKAKKSKKETSKPSLPVLLPSNILPASQQSLPSPRISHGEILRSMLLPNHQPMPTTVIPPQTLLVVNSTGQHPIYTKGMEGQQRLLTSFPPSQFPVVQTFPGHATPLVILPVQGVAGKTPPSTNSSPTFPPPKTN